ncbi:MAG: response regulator, partial [Herminiimonas sp.]|nr:response regulator [Herminiimonas sp.]
RELMQRERMLTARERELASLADNTPDILSRFDHEFRHVFVNKAVQSMTGHPPAHFLGRTWRQLSMPDAICTLWEDALGSVFKTGAPSAIEFSFDHDAHRRHYVTRLVPELGVDGLVEFVLGVTHDITARWEAEKVFQENAERTQLALNAAQAGAWAWDILSGDLTWSLENFALNARDPALGPPTHAEWEVLVHPDDRLAVITATNNALNRVTPEFRSEYRVCLPGMEVRWLQALGKINFSPTGEPLRMFGINLDVTDRKRTEQALRDDDRRKDEFLATLAHELRNPLAPLTTGLKILKLAPTGGPAARKTLDVMERQLRHMVHLIDDLLDISRITNGKVELRSSRLTIQDVVAHAVEAIQPLIDAAGHSLDLRMTATPIWIDGDMTRLAQVVSNLIGNAVKYTATAGRILVTADIKNDQAVICIADNGAGIPADMLPKIFTMFTQIDSTLKRAQGGLGIGLSLARSLLEMHGGSVVGESAGLGQGSTFTVTLPLAPTAVVVEADSRTTLATAGSTALVDSIDHEAPARRVFVIDDNVDAADMLAMMLEIDGFVTMTANDGETGLVALDTFQADIAFIDIGLPGISGYEVAHRIRMNSHHAGMLLIALTGMGSQADKQRAAEAGFDFHLTKPVEFAAVEALLASLSMTTKKNTLQEIPQSEATYHPIQEPV